MLVSTKGIVFRTVKYGETSLICTIYTRVLGLRSYMVHGVRKAKSKIPPALLQIGALVDLVVYNRPNKNIQQVKEIRIATVLTSIPFDFIKGCISLFIIEVAQKCIKEKAPNEALFDFLFGNIELLDLLEEGYTQLHLIYLVHFSSFLGFYPDGSAVKSLAEAIWFDYQEGCFTNILPGHKYYFGTEETHLLIQLQNYQLVDVKHLKISNVQKRRFIEEMLAFYTYNIEHFGTVNSYLVMKEILS